jgi:hypothetical protein
MNCLISGFYDFQKPEYQQKLEIGMLGNVMYFSEKKIPVFLAFLTKT